MSPSEFRQSELVCALLTNPFWRFTAHFGVFKLALVQILPNLGQQIRFPTHARRFSAYICGTTSNWNKNSPAFCVSIFSANVVLSPRSANGLTLRHCQVHLLLRENLSYNEEKLAYTVESVPFALLLVPPPFSNSHLSCLVSVSAMRLRCITLFDLTLFSVKQK